MAKTLGKLRQQTAKLRELEAPSDVSKGTRAFVKKHVYVVHPDANENDDDVFKATNVKRAKRAPDHGYEPGQDADIYESKMSDFATKMDDMEKMHDHPIWDESHPNHESAKRTLKNAPDSPQKRRIVKELGRDLKSGGEMQHHNRQYGLGEARERPLKKNGKLIPQDPHGEYWGNGNTLDLTPDMQDPKQQEWMRTHPANKKIAGGNVARPNVRSNSVIAKDLAKMQANKALQRNSYDPGEDYEHIAALSESDQSLLVDIYNSLTEDNQDRFLEIAETPEGVDKLLDFAITNSKGIK